MDFIDKPKSVRAGEELPTEIIEQFLKDTIPDLNGNLEIHQFPSGYSNLTYLLKIGDAELILRRPPFGTKAKTAHDMKREYDVLKNLKPVFPYCPTPLAYCDDKSLLGCDFYVMERISGIILRRELPKNLDISPASMRKLCEDLLEVHCKLHSLDYKKIGLENFGKPEGYVERQIMGWSKRYRAACTPDAPSFESVMEWLAAKMPPDYSRPSVIHGDYKFDNVVLDPTTLSIIGVLDWEMATTGDPLMDLGNSLGYWVQADDPDTFQIARMLPTNAPGAMTRDELTTRYSEITGISIADFDFYYCFGLFRLAVIAQQIYYRAYHGQTKDERFKALIWAVHSLEGAAMRVINKSRL